MPSIRSNRHKKPFFNFLGVIPGALIGISIGVFLGFWQGKPFPHEERVDPCENMYFLICQKPGIARDPTGSVHPDIEGERQTVKLYEEIIHKHRNWNVEQVNEELVQKIFDPNRRARILSAFTWVKHSLEHFIEQQPETVFNSIEKLQLKTRVHKTTLQIPPPASIYSDEPGIITKNEAFYERTSNGQMRLRVGGAYLFIAKSWFNLVFTLAHELAHSIDPCEIRTVRESFPAYDHLQACLIQNRIIATSPSRSECGENDQLSETFADWFAVQITAIALQLYSTEFDHSQILKAARNSVRDLCEQDDDINEIDTDLHPSPHMRIDQIFGRNPEIRRLLGCGPAPKAAAYCQFQTQIRQRISPVFQKLK